MRIQDVIEARRNPEINQGDRAKSVVKSIEPYFGNPLAYLSMTEIPKIGINPSSEHQTPLGIYAYPLASKIIVDQFRRDQLPWAKWTKYATLILAKPDLNILTSSDKNRRKESEKIDTMMTKLVGRRWENGLESMRPKTNTSGAMLYAKLDLAALLTAAHELPNDHSDKRYRRKIVIWNALFRKLGFDAVTDWGTGMVFTLEPTQTCFFSRDAIAYSHSYRNGRSEIYQDRDVVPNMNVFLRAFQAGKFNAKDAMRFFNAMLEKETPPAIDGTFTEYNRNIRVNDQNVKDFMSILAAAAPEAVIKLELPHNETLATRAARMKHEM